MFVWTLFYDAKYIETQIDYKMYSLFIFSTSLWKLYNIIILFNFKSNFTTTNMFLLYFCCVL